MEFKNRSEAIETITDANIYLKTEDAKELENKLRDEYYPIYGVWCERFGEFKVFAPFETLTEISNNRMKEGKKTTLIQEGSKEHPYLLLEG